MDLFAIAATLVGVGAGIILTTPRTAVKPGDDHPVTLIKELWKTFCAKSEQKANSLCGRVERSVYTYSDLIYSIQNERNVTYKIGLSPALFMYGSALLFKVITYNYAYTNQIITTPDSKLILYKAILFNGMTGMVTDVLTNPYEITRTKILMTRDLNSNTSCQLCQANVNNLGTMFKHLGESHGYQFFFTGVTACIPRGFISSSTHIFAYIVAKEIIEQKQGPYHIDIERRIAASVIGATFSCFCTSPLDLVITRLHTQPRYTSGRGLLYNGVRDCFQKTYQKEGILVFYKDVVFNCLKVGPFTALSLLLWDFLTHGKLEFDPDHLHFSQ